LRDRINGWAIAPIPQKPTDGHTVMEPPQGDRPDKNGMFYAEASILQ
jgi:hypothetical protein